MQELVFIVVGPSSLIMNKAAVSVYSSGAPILFEGDSGSKHQQIIRRMASSPDLLNPRGDNIGRMFRGTSESELPKPVKLYNQVPSRGSSVTLKRDSSYKNYVFQKMCVEYAPEVEEVPVSRKTSIGYAFSTGSLPRHTNPLAFSFNLRPPSTEHNMTDSLTSSHHNKNTINTWECTGTLTKSGVEVGDPNIMQDSKLESSRIEKLRYRLNKVTPQKIRPAIRIFHDDETEVPEFKVNKQNTKLSVLRSVKESSVQDAAEKLKNMNNKPMGSGFNVIAPKSLSIYSKGSSNTKNLAQLCKSQCEKVRPVPVAYKHPSVVEQGRDQAIREHMAKLYKRRDYLKYAIETTKDEGQLQFDNNAELLVKICQNEQRLAELRVKRRQAMEIIGGGTTGIRNQVDTLRRLLASRPPPVRESLSVTDQALGRMAIALCDADLPDETAYAKLLLDRIYR